MLIKKLYIPGDYVDLGENGEVSIPEDVKEIFKNPKAVEQWIEDKIKNGENGKVPIPEEVKGLFKDLKEGEFIILMLISQYNTQYLR